MNKQPPAPMSINASLDARTGVWTVHEESGWQRPGTTGPVTINNIINYGTPPRQSQANKWIATILTLAGLVFVAFMATQLSADALGMAVGMAFGILASVPSALLVLAIGNRRRD